MKPSRSLSLEYPLDLIPAGGSEVVRGSAAPIKHENKDAAGHYFHEFALRQAGVVGKPKSFVRFASFFSTLLQGRLEEATSSRDSQACRCERANVIHGDGGAKERGQRATNGRRRSEEGGTQTNVGDRAHSTAAASAVGKAAAAETAAALPLFLFLSFLSLFLSLLLSLCDPLSLSLSLSRAPSCCPPLSLASLTHCFLALPFDRKHTQPRDDSPPQKKLFSVDNDDDDDDGSSSDDASNRSSKVHRAPSSAASDDGGGNTSDGGGSYVPPPDWKEARAKKSTKDGKKGKKKKRIDLYELLGLQNLRWTATDKQIRDAYKRAALEHHPDKVASAARQRENEADAAEGAGGGGGEDGGGGGGFDQDAAEAKFKLVQEAYETLSDPARRREFDSTDWFDDSLPTECGEEEGAFFAAFAPAFKRQARWSAAPGGADAVPELGGADAPWEQVDKFYDFWFAFKSWREFPHEDEEDVEGAESREEKR